MCLWRSVQDTMNSDATILEYILAEPSSWCLVIRRDAVDIVRSSGKQQIETWFLLPESR